MQLAPEIKKQKQKNFPQEKRKIPAVPNGTAAHGEAEPHGGHSGPELQRTGRLVESTCMDFRDQMIDHSCVSGIAIVRANFSFIL